VRHEIITTIEISVPPERVWVELLDFEHYPEWNPFIRAIEGRPSEGSTLKVKIHPPGGMAMTFRPIVLCLNTNREFRWKGRLLLPGLFDGEHYYSLADGVDGSTLFTHGERFSGLLVRLFRSALDSRTRSGFEAMNLALKQRLEARVV